MDHVCLASLAILTQTSSEIKLGNCVARQPDTAANQHILVFYDDRHTINRGSEQ